MLDDNKIEIIRADFNNKLHADAIVALMSQYALDPMGGGHDLSEYVKKNLVDMLSKRQDVSVVLAFAGKQPVGLLTAIEGFSTFQCKPLLNIHDVIVKADARGQGIGSRLLREAELIAQDKACCKLTLEVLSGNEPAKAAYARFGFSSYQLDAQMGEAMFWEKRL